MQIKKAGHFQHTDVKVLNDVFGEIEEAKLWEMCESLDPAYPVRSDSEESKASQTF